jgi:hypothetical protein
MAIKNIITLGIGATPGNIKYFLLLGLDISEITGVVDLTLRDRTVALTLLPRTTDLTLCDRPIDLTLEPR